MTGKARTRSLRSLHWDESKHPRNDKGEFSRKGGVSWMKRVLKSVDAKFGDTSMGAHPDSPVSGRLQSSGKGHTLDLGAISRGAKERAVARAPKKEILPKGTFERGPSSASSSHARPLGTPESARSDAVEPSTLKPGDVFIRNGARHEVLSGPVKGKRAGVTVWRMQVRRQDGKEGPITLTHPVPKVAKSETPAARLPGGGEPRREVAGVATSRAARAPGGGATESTDDFLSRMQAKQQAARAAGGVTTSARGEQKPSVHAVMKEAGIERPDDNNAKSAISRANDRLARGEDPTSVAGTLREAARALELEREEVPEDDEQRYSELTQSIRSLERTAAALEGSSGPKGRAPGGGSVDTSRAKSETGGVTTSGIAKAQAAAREKRASELQDSTDPKDNGAKIKALEEGTLDHADLYRTAMAGPSGQRSAIKVGRVRHTPDNPSGEFRVTDRDGQLAGWVSRTNRNGEIRYSATQENYDGGTELLGWADSLAHAADVLTNGETAASSGGTLDARRISGRMFERNPARGKTVEQLDQEAAQREVSRAREALKNPNLGPQMRAAHERTIAEARSLGAGTPAAAVGERKAAAVATGQAGTPVKPAKPKIYEWSNVRRIPASSLEVGDEFIKPTTGSAFKVTSHGDGEVRGHGFQPLEGTKFTVTARQGNTITARDESGRELTQTIPGDRQPNVLRVGTEGPNARHERRIAEMRREAEAKSAARSAQDRATRDGVAPTDGRPNVSALLKMQGRNRDYDLGTSRGREKTMTPDIVRAGNGYMDDQRASAEIMNPLDGTGDYRYRIYSDATGATLEEGTGRDLADVKAKVDRIWSSQRGGGMARSKGAGPVRFEARQTERPKDLSRGDIGKGPFYDHAVVQINPDGTERVKIKTSSMSRAQEDAADLNAKESAAREAAGGGFDTTGLDERQIAGLMTIDPERRAEVAAQFRLANQGRAERAARDAAELAGINAVGMPGRGESPEAQRAKLLQLASRLEGADTSRLGNEHAAEVPGRGVNYSAYIMDGEGDRILDYSDHTGFTDPSGGRLADNEVPYYMAAYNANPGYGPQALRNEARRAMRGAGIEPAEFRRVPNDTRSERERIDQELRDLGVARQLGMRSGRLDPKREARIRTLEARREELRVEDRKASAKQFKKGDKITSRAGESEVVSINKEGYLRVQRADGTRGWVDPADATKVEAPATASAGEDFASSTRAALGEVDPRKAGGWNLPREAPKGSKIEFTSGGNIKVPAGPARQALKAMRRKTNVPFPDEIIAMLGKIDKADFDALSDVDRKAIEDELSLSISVGASREARGILARLRGEEVPEEVTAGRSFGANSLNTVFALGAMGHPESKVGRMLQREGRREEARRGVADVAAKLRQANTREEARASLEGLSLAQLREVHAKLLAEQPATPFNQGGLTTRNKADAVTQVVELAVGRNLDSQAIGRAVGGRSTGAAPLERARKELESLQGRLGLAEDRRRKSGARVASIAESRLRGKISEKRREISRLESEGKA